MSTSFGWKRKTTLKVTKKANEIFSADDDDGKHDLDDDQVDWFSNAKRQKTNVLESSSLKSQRLREEGSVLAEAERYWEALRKWNEASQLNPSDYKLFEMKAQVYLALHEVFPAVQAAECAVKLAPTWWIAYQTLGRTNLALGEVKLALRSFCKALHLRPDSEELREQDITWAQSLLVQHKKIQTEHLKEKLIKTESVTIRELHVSSTDDDSDEDDKRVVRYQGSAENDFEEPNFSDRKSWIKFKYK